MGDDHPCNVEGIGTVRIKMDDGRVRELKKMRYVPQLKRSLILVGTLETLGLVVSIRDGVLKITDRGKIAHKSVCFEVKI